MLASLSVAGATNIPLLDPGKLQIPATGADLNNLIGSINAAIAASITNIGLPTAPQLPNWRRVVAAVQNGSGRGTLLTLGDSTSMGAGAGSGGSTNLTGAWAKAWPQALAGNLRAPVSSNSICGDQNVTANSSTYQSYDSRVAAYGTGWATAGPTIGGALWKFTNGGGGGTFSFTPTHTFDTIKVIWTTLGGGNGTATVNVDGGASLGTIGAGSANSLSTATYTVAKNTHTINVVAANNGTVLLNALITYDSTVPAIDIVQCGWFGAVAANLADKSNGFQTPYGIDIIAPDLTIVDATINDSNAGTALADYSASMQTVITEAEKTGDTILMVGPPSNTTAATDGTLDTYIAVLKQLAINNVNYVLDLKQRWVSYAVISPVFPYLDTLHPEALGYQDIAQAVAQALGSVAAAP